MRIFVRPNWVRPRWDVNYKINNRLTIMKLIFNPYYDRGVWTPDPGQGTCVVGQKHVGPMGLIDELSMRLGLKGREKPQHEILYSWYQAIKEAVNSQMSPFYKDSFEIEPLAVAERLLAWRDALVMCGWIPEIELPDDLSCNAKAIMEELGGLEQAFRKSGCSTFSDKVRKVIDIVPGSGIMPMELEVVIPYNALEPVWRTLADRLKAEGWTVTFPEKGKELPKNIEVKRFKDYVDACMWVVLNRPQDLVICSDTAPLDWALRALGKPTTGSQTSASNHQIQHMFVDLMQLCCPRYDLASIVSYLNVHPHPLDQFKDADGHGGLREKLLNNVSSQGGLGRNEKTKVSFADILKQYAVNVSEDEIRFWLPFMEPDTAVVCDRVMTLAKSLGKWAKDKVAVFEKDEYRNDTYAECLRQLGQTCDVFISILDLLDYKGKRIGSDELKKLADYAYRPQKMSLYKSEIGSMNVAPTADSVASEVDAAIWMDPVPSAAPYPYSFLSDTDVEKLQGVMDIPTRRTLLIQSRESVNASLSNVGTLTLALCDKVGTETPAKHQILVETVHGKGDIPYAVFDESCLVHDELRNPRTQKLQHELGDGFFDGFFRETLSPSALEKLLERPFDYVMPYMMGLWGESAGSESATLGNVAHYVLESIYDKAKDDKGLCTPDQFEKVFKSDYDRIFDAAVMHCGLELNQPENALTCKYLKSCLKKFSVPAYLRLMKDNDLSIVGSEVDITGTIRCEGHDTDLHLKARIDLLLKDGKGNYVIIDLKYASSTTSRDKRETQIKEGTDYQLMMYRALVEEKIARGELAKAKVAAVGFFMLATSELLTAYPFMGVEPLEQKCTYQDALSALFTKYEEVMGNLRKGIIEEGEGMTRMEVTADGKTKSKKIKDNSFGENKVLKGKLN